MAVLIEFLKVWNGHGPDNSTYAYIEEEQAVILIQRGIAKPVNRNPELPHNVILDTRARR